jgi:hypothetical protein
MLGRFSAVDLGRLTGSRAAHCINGLAELEIERARFQEGRLQDAAARITAGPGLVSRGLLLAAAESLEMPCGPAAVSGDGLLPYEQLCLGFSISPGGVVLNGGSARGPPSAVLMDRTGILLSEPARPQPLAGLIRALCPADDSLVPANRQSAWLMLMLPLAPPSE